MSKMSKAIAVLGVVAGLGVAAMPLSSYAATDRYSQSAQAIVTTKVGGAISISVAGTGTDEASNSPLVDLGDLKINGVVASQPLTVTVKSNTQDQGYDLTIKSATAETALVNENGAKIPAATGTEAGNIKAGTSAWGYVVADAAVTADNVATTVWKGVSDVATPLKTEGYTTGDANDGSDSATYGFKNDTKLQFAASASGTQQEGVYKQTVVLTATVK